MSCPDCTHAATEPDWGGNFAFCRGCEVRAIAQAPKHVRDIFYRRVLDAEGAAAHGALKADVKAEYDRVQQLRSARRL